jgi:hypothetical protein
MKGFMESRLLRELAEDQERGWTIIKTTSQATKWESKLVQSAPEAAARFEAEQGTALLERSKPLRECVNRYLQKLVIVDSSANGLLEIRKQADDITLGEADRLMASVAIQQIPKCEELYELACLCVLRYSLEVEGPGVSYFGQDPLENVALMWRIQLLVDKLLSHFER